MVPAPTQSNIQAALRSFLLAVLPAGVEVITAKANRVPEPQGTEFVVVMPARYRRIETNIDTDADVKFTGSIAGTVLTVTAVVFGVIQVGATVFGVGVADNTVIVSPGTGTGGVGTYNVSQSQTVASETLASGAKTVEQHAEVIVQLEFHSASGAASDMAQVVSTLLRDDFGVQQFANQDPNYGAVPLYADDPKELPFINDQQQYEWRWVVEAGLQVNQMVSVPQQYADSAAVTVISVDATYTP